MRDADAPDDGGLDAKDKLEMKRDVNNELARQHDRTHLIVSTWKINHFPCFCPLSSVFSCSLFAVHVLSIFTSTIMGQSCWTRRDLMDCQFCSGPKYIFSDFRIALFSGDQ